MLSSCDSKSEQVLSLDDRLSEAEELALKQQRRDDGVFYFGFDLRSTPREDARQYLPFLDYLEDATGYQFELRFTPRDQSIIEQLGTGQIDFAAIGAVSYIQGHEKYAVLSLVRGLNEQGKAEYQSMIVVSPESDIKSLSDLKNRRFAFGSRDSTQGHLIPRIVLQENGIHLADLDAYIYTGSHHNCAESVVLNKYDACGMQDSMARIMEQQGLLRVLYESRYYPSSGIAAYSGLSSDVLSKVKQALIEFEPQGKHKADLYEWQKTEMPNGFVGSKPSDYYELRKWLINLGMMRPVS